MCCESCLAVSEVYDGFIEIYTEKAMNEFQKKKKLAKRKQFIEIRRI